MMDDALNKNLGGFEMIFKDVLLNYAELGAASSDQGHERISGFKTRGGMRGSRV